MPQMEKLGVGVGDDDGHLGAGVEFADAQRGADSGVAAADGDDMACGYDEVSSGESSGLGRVLGCSVRAGVGVRRW